MAKLSPEEKVLADIEKGSIAPVYALFSPQPSLLEPYLRLLAEKVVPEGMETWAHDRFSLDDTDVGTVLTTAMSVPMMVQRRLIEVHGAQALFSSKTPGTDHLLQYLENPSDSTVMALVFTSRPDKRTRVYKALTRHAVVVEFDPSNRRSGVVLVRRRLQEEGLRFGDEIPQMIYDYLGDQDLGLAVEKLALYVGEGGTIRPQDVEQVVGIHLEGRAFKFIDALFSRDLVKTLDEISYLRSEREEPLKILALVARQIRLVLLAKSDALPPDIKKRAFMARPLEAQARVLTYAHLERWQEAAMKADVRMKSSGVDGFTILTSMVFEFLA